VAENSFKRQLSCQFAWSIRDREKNVRTYPRSLSFSQNPLN